MIAAWSAICFVEAPGTCLDKVGRAAVFNFVLYMAKGLRQFLEAGSHSQRSPDRGLFSCLMPLASHDLFVSAFSTASGFLSITVK